MRSDVSEYLEDWDDSSHKYFSQISVHQISGSITTSSTMRSDVSEYLEDWDDRSPRRLYAGRAGLRLSPPRCKGVLLYVCVSVCVCVCAHTRLPSPRRLCACSHACIHVYIVYIYLYM